MSAANGHDFPELAEPVTRVTVFHGREPLSGHGAGALATVRRALVAMLGHGFISDLETHSRTGWTEWSWRSGTEDAAGVRAGILDTLGVIAPKDWEVK